MDKILQHVREVEFFCPPQYIGGYDNVSFSHDEFLQFISDLYERLSASAVDCSVSDPDVDILILIMPFEAEGVQFIYRHLEMGEHCDQLMTKEYYLREFDSESKRALGTT